MVHHTNKNTETIKLSQDIPSVSLLGQTGLKPVRKRRIRRIAEPHIQAHHQDGNTYYTYRRGVDPEIYLGTADNILKKVKGIW